MCHRRPVTNPRKFTLTNKLPQGPIFGPRRIRYKETQRGGQTNVSRKLSGERHTLEDKMYRMFATLLFLVASTAASWSQDLIPSAWQSQRGAILKVFNGDSATGNFGGVFITGPTGPCPGVPLDLQGRAQGPRVAFQTTRPWTSDCNATVLWSGRFVSPTTVAARWTAIHVAPDGHVARMRGTEVFHRL